MATIDLIHLFRGFRLLMQAILKWMVEFILFLFPLLDFLLYLKSEGEAELLELCCDDNILFHLKISANFVFFISYTLYLIGLYQPTYMVILAGTGNLLTFVYSQLCVILVLYCKDWLRYSFFPYLINLGKQDKI